MDISTVVLFLSSSWLLILSPGPDSIYVLTRGIAQGRKAGLISAAGVMVGLFVHTLFAALGISVILMTSATLFMAVKIIGAGYLIYLGVKTLLSKDSINISSDYETKNLSSLFWQGVLTNTLNPKVALFFLSYLPQFVSPESANFSMQLSLLGLIFSFCGVAYLATLGYFSGHIGSWIRTKESYLNMMRYITGSVFILLGIKLAVARRN